MIITRKDMIQTRKQLLKEMTEYILKYFDDTTDTYWDWTVYYIPAEYTENDLDFIANDDIEWELACRTFRRILKPILKSKKLTP